MARVGPHALLVLGLAAGPWLGANAARSEAELERLDRVVLEARDAWQARDPKRLDAATETLLQAAHPLAGWAAYWQLNARLQQANASELETFFSRWQGSYVEDRLRNDWLLELGRRQDWPSLVQTYPAFRMRDDREARCWWELARLKEGRKAPDDALAAWEDQREADTGCQALGQTLVDIRQLSHIHIWKQVREAVENSQIKLARQRLALIDPQLPGRFDTAIDSPARYLKKHPQPAGRSATHLAALALARLAASDPSEAARSMASGWERRLPDELAAWTWGTIGRQAAFRLLPEAPEHFERAWLRLSVAEHPGEAEELGHFDTPSDRAVATGRHRSLWTSETLAWQVRAALRAATDVRAPATAREHRWRQVLQGIEAMPADVASEAAWVYWKARALMALPGPAPGASSPTKTASTPEPGVHPAPAVAGPPTQARELLAGLAGPFDFYAQLAAEELGRPARLPDPPAPPTPAERADIRSQPGLVRAMRLIGLGLRSEGVREWNYTIGLGGPGGAPLSARQMMAAAHWAAEQEVWDRSIHAGDRGQASVQVRYPMPFKAEVLEATRAARLDPAYVYGLIRQESRFIVRARSRVGASGLMQLMPATAEWTARKIGIAYTPELVHDPAANIRLGVAYLKLALDNFGGAQALAAAAYNAGPGRPRRWREGSEIDAAAWVESIPFAETRDYVKKVLANAVTYSSLLNGRPASLRSRLGQVVGPAAALAGTPTPDLP